MMMVERGCSVFLCVLFISVLLWLSSNNIAVERALLQTRKMGGIDIEGHHGKNDGNKIPVHGSRSTPAPSRTEQGSSSPSKPTRNSSARHITSGTLNRYKPAVSCPSNGKYRACLPARQRPSPPRS